MVRLLLSGELPESTREGNPGRAIRIAGASSVPIVIEVRLLDEEGAARTALMALPGGGAESVAILPSERWLALGASRPRAAHDASFRPTRFEIRDRPGPGRDPCSVRLRLSIPAALAGGAPPGYSPFLSRVADHLDPDGPMTDRVDAAWRGAMVGAAFAHRNESRSRASIREEARTGGKRAPVAFDTTFATGPTPEMTMATAALVACLESGGGLPSPSHLAETYASRIVPEFVPQSCARGLANTRAGVLPPQSGLSLLDPGPAWDEDTSARARALVWGLLFPGDPYRAAAAAERDASITHAGSGVEDARFAAALLAASLAESRPRVDEMLDLAESFLTPGSESEQAVVGTREVWRRTRSADSTASWIEGTWIPRAEERHPAQPWSQSLVNLGFAVLALEDGGGDFSRSVRRAASCGLDADANAALCGAALGGSGGSASIPEEWRDATGEVFRAAVIGAENWRISSLAAAILAAGRSMHFDPAEAPR